MAWTDLLPSADVPPGGVFGSAVGGREVVLWRTRSGALSAVDAYCPHLGAHLANGGSVEEDALVCPFHGWRFTPTGETVALGYPGRCPASAKVATWGVEERDGRVWVEPPPEPERLPPVDRRGRFPAGWYKVAYSHELATPVERERFGRPCRVARTDAGVTVTLDGQIVPTLEQAGHVLCWYGDTDPAWEPPPLATLEGPGRVWMDFSEEVGSSLWDIAENPFDSAHLHTVHSLRLLGRPQVREDGHILHQTFEAHYAPSILDWLRPAVAVRSDTDLRAWGLGLTVARIEASLVPAVTIVGANTPVRDGRTEYNLVFISDPLPAPLRPLFRAVAHRIWRETLPERQIWAHKRYTPHPFVTGGERALAVFRRWAQQFPET